jgi:hypothetical protein
VVEDLLGREHADAGGGELDRKRKVVESAAELGHRLTRPDPGARAEELDRVLPIKRRHCVGDLALDAQELAARHEHPKLGAGAEER